MRDVQIIEEITSLKRRCVIIYKQMSFCNTRMEAIEKTVLRGGFWTRVLIIVWPNLFLRAVNAMHLSLMRQHDQQLEKAEQAPPAPKLTIVGANGTVSEKSINGR